MYDLVVAFADAPDAELQCLAYPLPFLAEEAIWFDAPCAADAGRRATAHVLVRGVAAVTEIAVAVPVDGGCDGRWTVGRWSQLRLTL